MAEKMLKAAKNWKTPEGMNSWSWMIHLKKYINDITKKKKHIPV